MKLDIQPIVSTVNVTESTASAARSAGNVAPETDFSTVLKQSSQQQNTVTDTNTRTVEDKETSADNLNIDVPQVSKLLYSEKNVSINEKNNGNVSQIETINEVYTPEFVNRITENSELDSSHDIFPFQSASLSEPNAEIPKKDVRLLKQVKTYGSQPSKSLYEMSVKSDETFIRSNTEKLFTASNNAVTPRNEVHNQQDQLVEQTIHTVQDTLSDTTESAIPIRLLDNNTDTIEVRIDVSDVSEEEMPKVLETLVQNLWVPIQNHLIHQNPLPSNPLNTDNVQSVNEGAEETEGISFKPLLDESVQTISGNKGTGKEISGKGDITTSVGMSSSGDDVVSANTQKTITVVPKNTEQPIAVTDNKTTNGESTTVREAETTVSKETVTPKITPSNVIYSIHGKQSASPATNNTTIPADEKHTSAQLTKNEESIVRQFVDKVFPPQNKKTENVVDKVVQSEQKTPLPNNGKSDISASPVTNNGKETITPLETPKETKTTVSVASENTTNEVEAEETLPKSSGRVYNSATKTSEQTAALKNTESKSSTPNTTEQNNIPIEFENSGDTVNTKENGKSVSSTNTPTHQSVKTERVNPKPVISELVENKVETVNNEPITHKQTLNTDTEIRNNLNISDENVQGAEEGNKEPFVTETQSKVKEQKSTAAQNGTVYKQPIQQSKVSVETYTVNDNNTDIIRDDSKSEDDQLHGVKEHQFIAKKSDDIVNENDKNTVINRVVNSSYQSEENVVDTEIVETVSPKISTTEAVKNTAVKNERPNNLVQSQTKIEEKQNSSMTEKVVIESSSISYEKKQSAVQNDAPEERIETPAQAKNTVSVHSKKSEAVINSQQNNESIIQPEYSVNNEFNDENNVETKDGVINNVHHREGASQKTETVKEKQPLSSEKVQKTEQKEITSENSGISEHNELAQAKPYGVKENTIESYVEISEPDIDTQTETKKSERKNTIEARNTKSTNEKPAESSVIVDNGNDVPDEVTTSKKGVPTNTAKNTVPVSTVGQKGSVIVESVAVPQTTDTNTEDQQIVQSADYDTENTVNEGKVEAPKNEVKKAHLISEPTKKTGNASVRTVAEETRQRVEKEEITVESKQPTNTVKASAENENKTSSAQRVVAKSNTENEAVEHRAGTAQQSEKGIVQSEIKPNKSEKHIHNNGIVNSNKLNAELNVSQKNISSEATVAVSESSEHIVYSDNNDNADMPQIKQESVHNGTISDTADIDNDDITTIPAPKVTNSELKQSSTKSVVLSEKVDTHNVARESSQSTVVESGKKESTAVLEDQANPSEKQSSQQHSVTPNKKAEISEHSDELGVHKAPSLKSEVTGKEIPKAKTVQSENAGKVIPNTVSVKPENTGKESANNTVGERTESKQPHAEVVRNNTTPTKSEQNAGNNEVNVGVTKTVLPEIPVEHVSDSKETINKSSTPYQNNGKVSSPKENSTLTQQRIPTSESKKNGVENTSTLSNQNNAEISDLSAEVADAGTQVDKEPKRGNNVKEALPKSNKVTVQETPEPITDTTVYESAESVVNNHTSDITDNLEGNEVKSSKNGISTKSEHKPITVGKTVEETENIEGADVNQVKTENGISDHSERVQNNADTNKNAIPSPSVKRKEVSLSQNDSLVENTTVPAENTIIKDVQEDTDNTLENPLPRQTTKAQESERVIARNKENLDKKYSAYEEYSNNTTNEEYPIPEHNLDVNKDSILENEADTYGNIEEQSSQTDEVTLTPTNTVQMPLITDNGNLYVVKNQDNTNSAIVVTNTVSETTENASPIPSTTGALHAIIEKASKAGVPVKNIVFKVRKKEPEITQAEHIGASKINTAESPQGVASKNTGGDTFQKTITTITEAAQPIVQTQGRAVGQSIPNTEELTNSAIPTRQIVSENKQVQNPKEISPNRFEVKADNNVTPNNNTASFTDENKGESDSLPKQHIHRNGRITPKDKINQSLNDSTFSDNVDNTVLTANAEKVESNNILDERKSETLLASKVKEEKASALQQSASTADVQRKEEKESKEESAAIHNTPENLGKVSVQNPTHEQHIVQPSSENNNQQIRAVDSISTARNTNTVQQKKTTISEPIKVPSDQFAVTTHEFVRARTNDDGMVRMVLQPEDLGTVTVQYTVRNNEAQLGVQVETQTAKNIIESQISTLRDQFTKQGITLDKIEVKVQSEEKNSASQQSFADGNKGGGTSQQDQESRQSFVRSFKHTAEARKAQTALNFTNSAFNRLFNTNI